MAVIIKKITKKTIFSLTAFLGLFLVFLLKLFFGESHANFSKMGSLIQQDINNSISPIARADTPPSDSSGCDGDGSGSGGSGSGSGS